MQEEIDQQINNIIHNESYNKEINYDDPHFISHLTTLMIAKTISNTEDELIAKLQQNITDHCLMLKERVLIQVKQEIRCLLQEHYPLYAKTNHLIDFYWAQIKENRLATAQFIRDNLIGDKPNPVLWEECLQHNLCMDFFDQLESFRQDPFFHIYVDLKLRWRKHIKTD